MRKDIEKIIRNAYPSNDYEKRDLSELDNCVNSNIIPEIIKKIKNIGNVRIEFITDTSYGVCYEITIYIPKMFFDEFFKSYKVRKVFLLKKLGNPVKAYPVASAVINIL